MVYAKINSSAKFTASCSKPLFASKSWWENKNN